MISNFKLIRKPFNNTIKKTKINWIKCKIKHNIYLSKLLFKNEKYKFYTNKNNFYPYGFYKVSTGKKKYFIKIIEKHNYNKEKEILNLEKWLLKKK